MRLRSIHNDSWDPSRQVKEDEDRDADDSEDGDVGNSGDSDELMRL
jgi:hypothetical protein